MSFSTWGGGRGWISVNQEYFLTFVIKNCLLDIPFKKVKFTLINRRLRFVIISEKLDRFLIVGNFYYSKTLVIIIL